MQVSDFLWHAAIIIPIEFAFLHGTFIGPMLIEGFHAIFNFTGLDVVFNAAQSFLGETLGWEFAQNAIPHGEPGHVCPIDGFFAGEALLPQENGGFNPGISDSVGAEAFIPGKIVEDPPLYNPGW